ncbi:MAG: hypothetical protein FWD16_02770 [Clostridia bacterium]|nr:hypothetical protein [Clostridia bacterium]
MQKTALGFVEYLRANKINPVLTNHNAWKAVCKGKALLYIRICDADHYRRRCPDNPPSWVITLYFDNLKKYEDMVISEGLQSIIWDNVGYYCKSCRGCAPGGDITVLGKEINGVCIKVPLTWAFDPDQATINGIKRLLELEQKARQEK